MVRGVRGGGATLIPATDCKTARESDLSESTRRDRDEDARDEVAIDADVDAEQL